MTAPTTPGAGGASGGPDAPGRRDARAPADGGPFRDAPAESAGAASLDEGGFVLLRNASGSPAPESGILSQTLAKAGGVRVTRFAFAAGEELTEHTSSRPALLHFLRGRARLTLGGETVEVGPGDHLHMRAGLPHAVAALEPLEFVLTLLPGGNEG